MKLLLILLSLFLTGTTNATNYYFSSSTGDDSRTSAQAQNPATPWKTLSKLNSFFSSLIAGDNVLFQRGDVFSGNIIINKPGTSGSPITLGAYGTGAKPVISGFTSVDTWTSLGGNIWESTGAVSTLATCNILSIAGTNYAKGRSPDNGYWTISSTNGSTTITDATHLSSSVVSVGAEVVVRELMYEVNNHVINNVSGNTITFGAGSIPGSPWGYFIQNDVKACNLQNEWAYNSSTKKISIYSTGSPTSVKAPSVDEAVNLNSKDYISFDNLDIQGYNTTGINTTSRTGISIQNCDFSFIGVNAIYGYPNSASLRVTASTFTDIGSRAIHGGSSSNAYISGNTLLRVGHYAGMGSNGDDSYTGIISNGDNAEVSYNSITNVGYCGIRWDGNATVIKNNFVKNTTYIKDDGGAIYCYPVQFGNTPHTQVTRTVRDNIVINALSAPAGSPYGNQGCGIYMDGQSPNINVIHNSVGNDNTVSTGFLGIFVNGGHDIYCDSNTTYNWIVGYYLTKIGGPIDNETVTHNVIVARTTNASCGLGQYATEFLPAATSMPASFVASNNVYARPLDQSNGWVYKDFGAACNTLAQWQSVTGKDAGSTSSPVTITNANDLRFEYNETSVGKTIPLGANYIDMKNVTYPGTITLAPYSSAVLLKTSAGNVAPTANAGTDQIIILPTATVNLSGSGTDADGTIASYAWTKVSGPTGIITSITSAITTVTALLQGVYKFELKVTDNAGAVGRDTVQITVNILGNQAPTVNAGADQTIVLPTSTVSLSGTGTDADGTISAYAWTKVSGPTSGTITTSTAAATTVTAMVQGVYKFELKVTDNSGATDTDTMQVTVNASGNIAPTANAGADQTIVLPTSTVSLSGTGTDADGTISSYLWTKVSGPTSGTITTSTSAATTVTAMVQAVYNFELKITDNAGAVGRDTLQVTVNAATGTNTPYSGAPKIIPGTIEAEDFDNGGQNIAYYDLTPGNSGGAYRPTESVDIQTSTEAVANIGWTDVGEWTKYTVNVLSTGTYTLQARVSSMNAASSFRVEMDGVTIATITVPNTGGYQAWQTVTIPNINLTAGVKVMRIYFITGGFNINYVTFTSATNLSPTSNAGVDQIITLPTNSTSLTGIGSDVDGTISSYLWTKISGPTAGTITTASAASTTITGLTAGTYVYKLTVTDNSGATATDNLQVTVNAAINVVPISNAGTDQIITLPTSTITLSGTGTDTDGTIASYLWTKMSGPAGGTITNSAASLTTVTGLTAGTYVFQLKVTDNLGATATDNVQVIVNAAAGTGSKIINVNIYGGSNPFNDTKWNNWKPVVNATSSNFKYEDGTQSTANATISAQASIVDNGANYASAATGCPPAVLRYYSKNTAQRTITVKGLSASKQYTFKFYASATVTPSGTTYLIGSVSNDIMTYNNLNMVAPIVNVIPDANGTVTAKLLSIYTYNYISGFTITEQTGSVAGRSTQSAESDVINDNITNTAVEPETMKVNIFPNPFTTSVQIQLNSMQEGAYQLSLVDVSGKNVWKKIISQGKGSVTETINTGNFPGGMYILQIISPDQKKTTYKIVKAN